MPIGKKIRIYDLARDLKQDAKRVMEDLRREGADVSVPSNSVKHGAGRKGASASTSRKPKSHPKRAIKIIKGREERSKPNRRRKQVVEPVEALGSGTG